MPGLPGHFVVIAIPVVRDAKVTLVLGALVRADAFSAILRRQQTPAAWRWSLARRSSAP
jgi:hypothetical protein